MQYNNTEKELDPYDCTDFSFYYKKNKGSVVARDYCYNQNTRAEYYAYCKRNGDKYIGCQKQYDFTSGFPSIHSFHTSVLLHQLNYTFNLSFYRDIMCGKLFCENGNDNPNYGRLVTFNNCKATFYGSPEEDYGQVDTGTKCGEGLVRLISVNNANTPTSTSSLTSISSKTSKKRKNEAISTCTWPFL